jgi:hypothetical protein
MKQKKGRYPEATALLWIAQLVLLFEKSCHIGFAINSIPE